MGDDGEVSGVGQGIAVLIGGEAEVYIVVLVELLRVPDFGLLLFFYLKEVMICVLEFDFFCFLLL